MYNYLDSFGLEILIKNQFFDYTNLENPVQTFFSYPLDFIVRADNSKKVNFYIRKSQYELKEGWHSLGDSRKGEFYSIDRREEDSIYLNPSHFNNTVNLLLGIDFFLEPLMNQFERRSLTLFEAFGTIGGIFEILRIITSLFTGFYAQYAFRRSLIKSIKKSKARSCHSK